MTAFQTKPGTAIDRHGRAVFLGDILRTGSDGAIDILLADGTTFSLGAGGRLVLDEFIYDPGADDNSSLFSMLEGTFIFVSGAVAESGPDAMQVRTPAGTIGVRGTSVGGIIDSANGAVACALLPDPDGKVGAVKVTTDAGEQVLDAAGESTRARRRTVRPKAPEVMADADIRGIFSEVLAVEPKPPERFLLYFRSGSVKLTGKSRAMFPDILAAVRARSSTFISVTGHTDRTGSSEYNLALSLKRAERVKALLVKEGVPAKSITVSSHGEANPLVKTDDGVAEPKNRRVEVIVR